MVGRSIAAARPVGKFQALGALDFRRLWLSSIAFGVGQQMEAMILGWYVLVLTDSATIVGLVGAARWGGMLLAPFCGVLADRRPRRTLLIIVQSVSLTSMATAALLAATGRLSLPFLITAVLVAGLARAFDQTVRQTFVADLVDRERLTGAVALVQMAMNGSNIIAPLIAGRIYGFSGVAACYAVISALTLCAVLATSGIQSRAAGSVENRGVSPLRSMGEGLSYVRRTPIVGALLWIAAIANLCPFPLTFAMLPSFSRDVLHVGAGGLSVLLAAAGTGALLGNLVLGSLGLVRRRGIISLTGTFAWMAVLVLFGLSRSYPISLLLLVGFGVAQAMSLSIVAVLLLNLTPAELRGRVMSVRMFAIATLPIGAIAAGWLIDHIGAPTTSIIFGVTGALLTALVAVLTPALAREQ